MEKHAKNIKDTKVEIALLRVGLEDGDDKVVR
jgi:hypothetical protein